MADTPEFRQPTPHNPDLVVGDDTAEVRSDFIQPPNRGVQEHTSPFVQPVNHNPDMVVGDTLDEVQSEFRTPTLHNPSLVVGDTLDEVPPPPSLGVPNPPFIADDVATTPSPAPWNPSDVALPPPHNPGGVVGDDLSEVDQPTGLTVPPAPTVPEDVPLPAPHIPSDDVDLPTLSTPDPVMMQPTPQDAQQQADSVNHSPRTVSQIMADLRQRDERLERYLSSLGEDMFYRAVGGPADGPGSRALDPSVTSKVLSNFITNTGKYGAPAFVAIQTALHRMNAKYGKIFNPLYIAALLGPSSVNKIALDVDENIHTRTTSLEDGLAVDQVRLGHGEFSKIQDQNTYGPDTQYGDGAVVPMGAFVDLALGDISDPQGASIVQSVSENVEYPGGLRRRHIDMAKMFDRNNGKLLPSLASNSRSRKSSQEDSKLAAASFNWRGSKGVIPAAMGVDDEIYGIVDSPIDDDDAYVPLVFQDLRPGPDGRMRMVYFRAINVQSGESYSPSWNEEEAFGRVDPIVGYRGTGRSITLSFVVHAFSPEDLRIIYMKRNWLTSLVYPEVSDDLLLSSGPICRLRVGDLYNNSRGGLPGIIKSLEFDDSEQVWELKRGYKVPHGFGVSVTFQVLHEGTPGLNRGHFTVVRASIPERLQSDPSRFDTIKTEVDDGLFSSITPPRRRS
jgi:hypothetical protein